MHGYIIAEQMLGISDSVRSITKEATVRHTTVCCTMSCIPRWPPLNAAAHLEHDLCLVPFWWNAQVLSRAELLHSKQSPEH